MDSKVCSVEGCQRKRRTRGWCSRHYQRWLNHGDPLFAHKRIEFGCSIPDCDLPHAARGWCNKHYRRWRHSAFREIENKQNRQRRASDPEKAKAQQARWYVNNREEAREKIRRYAVTHPEQARERRARYWSSNRESIRERYARWRAANPAKLTAQYERRRALVSGSTGSFTSEEWQRLCEQYGYRCLCCGLGFQLTADHVVPLSKGGSNDIGNIQPLCRSCNARKSTKTIDYRLEVKSQVNGG